MMGEVIRVSGRIPEVGDLLREAMVSQRFADVALCCSGGQRFLAHRLVLSAASPYLQEVLLAHGRAAGYGEPITMILADVEGPELSAILGFVYTGSATIPKSRLEAFTRAAETLHLTIPKFTAPSSFDRPNHEVSMHSLNRGDDCKLNGNVKTEVTRTEARYPCHEDCSNSSSSWNFRVDCSRRDYEPSDDWLIARSTGPSSDIIGGSTRACVVETPNDSDRSDELLVGKDSGLLHFRRERILKVRCGEGKIGRSLHDHETTMRPGDPCGEKGFVPWSQKRSVMADDFDSFVDTSISFPEKDHDPYDPRVHSEVRNFVRFGVQSLDSLSAPITPDNFVSRTVVESPRAYETTGERKDRPDGDFEGSPESVRIGASLLSRHQTTARSSVTFEKQDYDSSVMTIPIRLPPAATLLFTAKAETAVSSSPDVARTFANNSTIIGARNSCGDSCCAWRTPRRHVANRVPASPWCQLARPAHHSPKTRPQLPRKPDEIAKAPPPSRVDWNASVLSSDTSGASTFLSPTTTMIYVDKQLANAPSSHLDGNDRKNDSAGSTHGFQVPKTMGNPSSRLEVEPNNATQIPDPINYYDEIKTYEKSASLATVAIEQFSSVITSRDVARASEKSVTKADILRKELRPHRQSDEASSIIANHEESRVRISQHAISPEATNKQIINDPPTCNPPPASTRIELSHPISRLCDSVRKSNDESVRQAEPSFSLEITRNTSNCLPPTTTTTEEIVETWHEDKANSRGKTILFMAGGILQSDDNNNEAAMEGTENDVRNVDPIRLENGNERITGEDGVAVNEEHKCDQCGKTFVTRASLKVHVRTHSGEKPFRCNDCGKEFSQLRNYKYHRSVHEGTREFAATCPECGKYFNDRGYLSSHMKIHRNRKEYACTECGKSFNQRVAYNMHVRIHTGVKPHQCDQCGKAFSRKMLLKQHLRTHSGERPYQCQICHKAFADRSNMTLHTRLHSGLKPYQCTLCSKAFTKKHHLKTHLNYHTGTKPYSCPNCSLRFSQSSNMRTHYKKCCSIVGGGLIEHRQTNEDSASSDKRQAAAASRTNDVAIRDSASMRIVEAPSVGGRTNALTPPSSDQESSSFQTPTKRVESASLRTRASRILDVVNAVGAHDT